MIFVLNLFAIAYLYLQRYFNNGLPLRLELRSISDFIYLSEFLLFIIFYFIANKGKNNLIRAVLVFNLLLILAVQLVLKFKLFSGIYFLGYPLEKSITAILFSAIFIITLFVTIYFINGAMKSNLKLINTFYQIILFIVVLLSIAIFLNVTYRSSDINELSQSKFNYAVVFGAAVNVDKPYPILEARINKAQELLDEKIVNKILLTGSASPGELSEAKTSYNYLLKKGVSQNKMRYEDKTTTTLEQVKFLKKLQKSENATFIAVSDKFHLRRINEMAKFFDVKIRTIASGKKLSTEKEIYYRLRDSVALLLFLFFAN